MKKLREQNSFLSKKNSLLEAENSILSERLTEWASEIRSQLGDHSAFNEQVALVQRNSTAPYLEVASYPASLPMIDYEKTAPSRVPDINIIKAFIRCVEVKPDMYANQIRINLIDKNGTLSYAVSDEVRRSIRDDKYIARMIAQQMGYD